MINKRFINKTALITGGASGIGHATALRLAQEGARIAIADINSETGKKTVNKIKVEGGKAIFVLSDITQSSDVKRICRETVKSFKHIDILVNSAGIGTGGTVVDVSEDEWDNVMSLDLKALYLCSKYVIPEMVKNEYGSIVHISSVGGQRGDWGGAVFSAAKAGVINLTRHMAIAHAKEGIRVNCVCPGVIETPLVKNWLSDPLKKKTVIARHPLGRLGRAEEVASAVAFLASEEASYITGAILPVDGGNLCMGR